VTEILETDRLILKPRQVGEAAVYRHLWTERDERVPPHRRIDREGRPTVEDMAAVIDGERDEPGPRLLAVYVKDPDELIGYCGLIPREGGRHDEPELAFELLRATHGRGYATEAARAVVEWADAAGYGCLWASVWDWNVASRRVLQKVGFRETGRVEAESEHGRSLLTVRTPH